jgi:uncharacterized membrane protein
MLKTYLLFLLVYILVDLVWIYGAQNMHLKMVQDVQGSSLSANMYAALLYYLLAGLLFACIVKPYATTEKDVIKLAALLGLLMFGTFDLTNKALFKGYTWKYVILDMMWGVFSITLTSYIVWKANL